MKTSKLLAQARPSVENGDTRYICLAIARLLNKKRRLTRSDIQAARRARDHIMTLLHPCISLEQWLTKRGVKTWAVTDPVRRTKLRQTRLNWMDDLITYFEAKGD